MAGTLRKRATGMFTKAPTAPEALHVPKHPHQLTEQTFTLSLPETQTTIDTISEDMETSRPYHYNPQEMDYSPESTLDDLQLSHISPEFARMRPWDFQLPEYEFYNESESWFNENVSLEDLTLQDLNLSNDILLDENVVATTIFFAKAGKPKMVNVSPPPSIHSSRRSQSSEYSGRYHSRSPSYASQAGSKSASDESDYEDDSSLSTPDTPISNHSKGFFSFQKRKPVAVYLPGPKKTSTAT